MINLTLIPRASLAVPAAVQQAFQGTTLQVQPSPGSGAETAPGLTFARTSKPTADFDAVRAGVRTIVETTVVDLSVAHTIAAGTPVVLQIQGTAFFIDKGTDVGLATLHIQDQTNTPVNSINVFPGDAYDVPFTFVVIENTAQAGKVLRIHYGTDISFKPGLGGNITFTGGVSILQTAAGSAQNGDAATANGKAFAVNFFDNAVAAQVSAVGVANPAASGKVSFIDRVTLNSNVATLVVCNIQTDVFLTDVGTGVLKLSPNTPSTSRGKSQNNIALSATILTFGLQANVDRDIVFASPFELVAGRSLCFQSLTVNLTLNGFAEGREY